MTPHRFGRPGTMSLVRLCMAGLLVAAAASAQSVAMAPMMADSSAGSMAPMSMVG